MIIKVFIAVACFLVVVAIVDNVMTNETISEQDQVYSGPVPLGHNAEHFRETGETIKEVSV